MSNDLDGSTSLVTLVRDYARSLGVTLDAHTMETTAGIARMIINGQVGESVASGHPAENQWKLAARAVAHARRFRIDGGELYRCLRDDFT